VRAKKHTPLFLSKVLKVLHHKLMDVCPFVPFGWRFASWWPWTGEIFLASSLFCSVRFWALCSRDFAPLLLPFSTLIGWPYKLQTHPPANTPTQSPNLSSSALILLTNAAALCQSPLGLLIGLVLPKYKSLHSRQGVFSLSGGFFGNFPGRFLQS